MPGTSAFAEARAGWRAGANQGDSSPADLSIFCLRSCAPRRLPAAGAPCVARFPHPWSPARAAKHTYIDAFNGKTVTRETLLRYTFKSHLVNVLIRGGGRHGGAILRDFFFCGTFLNVYTRTDNLR